MSDQSFSSGDPATQEPAQPSFQDNGGDGGDGKPAEEQLTQEQLAEILKRDEHAQKHIKTLEDEARERKSQLETLQSKIAEMEGKLSQQETFEQALEKLNKQRNGNGDEADQTKVNPDQIAQTVLQQLKEQEQMKLAEQNKVQAVQAAKERYGDSYLDKVNEKAQALGMTLQDVDELASNKPAVFKTLFIGEAQAPKKDTGKFGQNSRGVEENVDTTTATQRQLYRENPRKYFSAENYARVAEQIKNK